MHAFVNELQRPIGTYLCGRRLYKVMRYWESAPTSADRQMKASATRDITVGGPELAGQALKAGLVDELHLFLVPAVVGGGKPSPAQGCPPRAGAAG